MIDRRQLFGLVGVAVAFLLPLLVLFGPVLFRDLTIVPYDVLSLDPAFSATLAELGVTRVHNDLIADLLYQNVVWKTYLTEAAAVGSVPLWNPGIFGGMPFLAAGQASALYPGTLLFLVMSPDRAFGYHAVLHLWLAAMAMYALGRSMRLGRGPSMLMGYAWSLSSLLVINTVFPMLQVGLAWAPLMLAAVEVLARRNEQPGHRPWLPHGGAAAAVVVLGLATAFVTLAGHPEMLAYTTLTVAAYGLFRGGTLVPGRGWGPGLRVVVWSGLGGLAGVLLAATQLVPLAELASWNFRAAGSYAEAVQHAFGVRQAATFVLPDFFGNPADHSAFDLATREIVQLDGHTMWGVATGAKNYVEAAAYLGVLPLLLAVVAVFGARRSERWFFVGWALLSLSFAFGLPTYRLIYEVLPGWEQLRTPFRWIYPYALCTVVLAGMGADRLTWRVGSAWARLVGLLGLTAGAVGAGILVVSYRVPARWLGAVADGIQVLPGATEAVAERFASLESFSGYLYLQAVHLVVALLAAGLVVLLLDRTRGRRWVFALAGVILALDLVAVSWGFFPALDPALGDVSPPTARVLADATEAKWGRIVGFGDGKVWWPNTGMRYGLSDVRGYDSIIPEWTTASINAIEDQSDWLGFNRIGNLREAESLAHPLLAALGGRYVVTTEDVEREGLRGVHSGPVNVYENEAALPRAWVVDRVRVVTDTTLMARALDDFAPRNEVLLGESPDENVWENLEPGPAVPRPGATVTEAQDRLDVEVYTPRAAMLVVSEAFAPGWRAWVDSGDGEVEVPVFRANGMLQAVPIPPGLTRVRLSYFPTSVKVGLYGSFLGALLLFLVAAYAVWSKFFSVDPRDAVSRVAVNSGFPMAAALLNKTVDFAFAMLMLRILGPGDAGKFYTAITVIAFAEIVTNFGLNLFTTREVARRPDEAPTYLAQTSLLRLGLWVVTLPGLAAYVLFRAATGTPLAPDTVLAVVLLTIALIPGNLNTALTSVFQAFEDMVLPAGVTIVSNLVRVSLGALVLLAGYGFVGLAAVAIVVNWLTFGILAVRLFRLGVRPAVSWRPGVMRVMAVTSFPFMLNHLLQTVFFKIDVLLLSQLSGDQVVGWYSAAYKWVDALLIIPGYFTMALFPLMSRQAETDREGLRNAYELGQRWLLMLALPVAMATTFLAEDLIRVLAGAEFLPAGAVALRVMIWFLPLSFANGLTQYVLLAMDRQRSVTPAFVAAVTFNIVANLWAIPRYGFVGAATVTILSELALLVPFAWAVRDLGAPPLPVLIWRPALATSVMGGLLVGLDAADVNLWLSAAAGVSAYLLVLRGIGGITDTDRRLFGRLVNRA